MRIVLALAILCAPLAALAQPGPDNSAPSASPALAASSPPLASATRLELSLRGGIATSTYTDEYFSASGTGPSLDVEFGVRRGRWSFLGYLDYATAAASSYSIAPMASDAQTPLVMSYAGFGSRVRIHVGNWFFGVGAGGEAIRANTASGSKLDAGFQPMLDVSVGYLLPMIAGFRPEVVLTPQITMVADEAGSLEITRLELGFAF